MSRGLFERRALQRLALPALDGAALLAAAAWAQTERIGDTDWPLGTPPPK